MTAERITIDGGVVTKASTTGAAGTILHPDRVGKYRFFVSHIDADGYEHLLWDGQSYDLAIGAAERAKRVLGINAPIDDIVGGRGI